MLSPCCLRGALGAGIARTAKRAWPGQDDGPYRLLVATLAALCTSELQARAAPAARPDAARAAPVHPQEEVEETAACQPCDDDETGPGSVEVFYDEAVLSPKRAFIVMSKDRARSPVEVCP